MGNFWTGYAWPTLIIAIEVIIVVVPLLLAIAMLTYAERKVLALSQLRKGPNVVGPFGLLQPFADGLKLLHKETIIPSGANRVVFVVAPLITFTLALVAWAVIPFGYGVVISDINVGLLYLFAISSLGVYGIILAGWASNSRYAFLGALRSAAQMVSNEVAIGFVLRDRAAVRGLAQSDRDRRSAAPHLVCGPAAADVRDLLHFRVGRNRTRSFRSAGGGKRKSSPAILSNIHQWPSPCSTLANTAT